MKEFTYLGYTFQRNGRQEAHIRDRVRKEVAVLDTGYREEKI